MIRTIMISSIIFIQFFQNSNIINYWSEGSIVPIPSFSEYLDSTNKLLTYELSEEKDYNLDLKQFQLFCKKQDHKKII